LRGIYGGERYVIALNDTGNMTGLIFLDGNQLSFEYDEFARLLEESRPWAAAFVTYDECHHLVAAADALTRQQPLSVSRTESTAH
jgi:YD repeat-containing protein